LGEKKRGEEKVPGFLILGEAVKVRLRRDQAKKKEKRTALSGQHAAKEKGKGEGNLLRVAQEGGLERKSDVKRPWKDEKSLFNFLVIKKGKKSESGIGFELQVTDYLSKGITETIWYWGWGKGRKIRFDLDWGGQSSRSSFVSAKGWKRKS